MPKELTIHHFNDVYHIGDSDLVARFAHLFNQSGLPQSTLQATSSVRIFSGDVFSPSTESSIMQGENMVPILNELGIDIACYDFDFGESRLVEISDRTIFPWVLSNAVRRLADSSGTQPSCHSFLASAHEYIVRDLAGYKIGFFGLAGTDWPSNCQHLPPADILSPVEVSRRLAWTLRVEKKCDFVIAISHMRLIEDLEVANASISADTKVDLILGGHDHQVLCRRAGDTNIDPEVIIQGKDYSEIVVDGKVHPDTEGDVRIVKSGTDWKSYSIVHLLIDGFPGKKPTIKSSRVQQWTDITQTQAYESIPKCPKMSKALTSVYDQINTVVQHSLFHSKVPLDGRSSKIRSQETSLGNLLADAVKAFYDTDIALVNSGGIRCDRIIQPTINGQSKALTVKDMIDILPFDNPFVVKIVRGHDILDALSNSFSDAHTDGRFLQLSGLRVSADWHRPERDRLISARYCPQKGPPTSIVAGKTYSVAMVSFIAAGFDGYSSFQRAETIIGEEGAMTDTGLLLKVLGYESHSEGFRVEEKQGEGDDVDLGVGRARAAIVVGYDERDGLPVVGPVMDGRIKFIEEGPRL